MKVTSLMSSATAREPLAWLYEHGRVTFRDTDELGRTHVTVRLHPAALGRFERLYPDLAG